MDFNIKLSKLFPHSFTFSKTPWGLIRSYLSLLSLWETRSKTTDRLVASNPQVQTKQDPASRYDRARARRMDRVASAGKIDRLRKRVHEPSTTTQQCAQLHTTFEKVDVSRSCKSGKSVTVGLRVHSPWVPPHRETLWAAEEFQQLFQPNPA